MQPVTGSTLPSTTPAHAGRPRVESPRARAPRPGRRVPLWLWTSVLACVAIAAALVSHGRKQAAKPLAPAVVRVVAVRAGALERTLRLVGSTAAERSVELRAPYLRGRRSGGDFRLLIENLIGAGTRVSKGRVVAGFEPLYMQLYLDYEKARRLNSQEGLKQAQAAYELLLTAHRQKIRTARAAMDKAALDVKTTPVRSAIQSAKLRLAYEEAEAAYRELLKEVPFVEVSAKADLERARLEVREALVEEQRAQNNLDGMAVRAPLNGVAIISEIYYAGERKRIQAGDRIGRGQTYMQIVDLGSIVVEAKANQVDVESLRLSAPARVYFDAYPGLVLPGRLQSVGPYAKSSGQRRDYVSQVPVRVKLEGQDPRVIPNLSVAAEVVLAREESGGIVPREAVFYDPEDRQPYAIVKTPAGWEKRDLELGLSNHVAVAVRAGVRDGDVVAAEMPAVAF